MNLRLPAISAILVLIVMVVPLLAHHSVQAQFDLNKPITLTGKITKVEWINPHSYLLMEVSDDKGNVKRWAFEMAGPGALGKSGLSRADRGGLKAGDVVTVNGMACLQRTVPTWDFSRTSSCPTAGFSPCGPTIPTRDEGEI